LCICADSEGETINDTKRVPACSKEFGFWAGPSCPGYTDVKQCSSDDLFPCSDNYGDILEKLNDSNDDAKYIASFWSTNDTIIGPSNRAYGWRTSIVLGTKKEMKYDGLTLSRLNGRDVHVNGMAILFRFSEEENGHVKRPLSRDILLSVKDREDENGEELALERFDVAEFKEFGVV
uniref:Uncharacterized protein n=1 Tax=Meloidogyne floridensis TaxID=298350 RepID=A0A915NXV9_9BILA